tara:strand:+ start:1486 stop:2520 length:1035 start_codon:yes stop_codon:yes gene_type:complete
MSINSYSRPRLFIGDKEVISFNSIQFSDSGNNLSTSLNVVLTDPEIRRSALMNQNVTFFLNHGSDDTVPFFRGRIRQINPSDTSLQFTAFDVLSLLTGNECVKLTLSDESNYDGFTLSQFLNDYITTNININETIIGLDMINETDPVVTLSGVRGENLSPLEIITNNLPKNEDSLSDIRNNILTVVDDGNKSNICFVKEQSIDDAGVSFTYSDGIKQLSITKRPAPNILYTTIKGNRVTYKHNNLATGVTAEQIKGNFDYPDQAKQAAFVQATDAEKDSEINIMTTKGHYLKNGNIILLNVHDYPEQIGKHKIVSKQVTTSRSGTTCNLRLSKQRPLVSDYLSS